MSCSDEMDFWDANEDNILRSLIAEFGIRSWGQIASYFTNRSARHCHDR